jgi:hypothetical protein
MEGLGKGGQGPISGCCAIEEEEVVVVVVVVVSHRIMVGVIAIICYYCLNDTNCFVLSFDCVDIYFVSLFGSFLLRKYR